MISSTLRAVRELLALARGPSADACCEEVALHLAGCGPVMMLSSTLMPLNSAMFWNVRAMPVCGDLVRVHVAARACRGR